MTGHFEAKKHGYRQTQDGVVVSFVLHPNDLDAAFAIAALGTRYMVAFAEIGADEKPVEAPPKPEPKDRRSWHQLSYAEQAGIRSSEPEFISFMATKTAAECAEEVRHYCGVGSRAEIVKGSIAGGHWATLEDQYQAHLTDKRYADVRR